MDIEDSDTAGGDTDSPNDRTDLSS